MPLYKQYEDWSWVKAMKYVATPDGEITKDNLQNWREYYKSDPQWYKDWLSIQVPPHPPEVPIDTIEE